MVALALAAPVSAQVTGPPFSFTNGTPANADEVNSDFTTIYGAALNRAGGTMTGTLNSLTILPTVTNASDIGSTSFFYRTAYLRTSLVFGQTGGNYTITPANPAASRALSLNDPGGSDAFAYLAATQTLTNKTLTAPVLSGSVTGTYTLGGTPTITSPAISSPVFSGTATGTYTLGGTPSIAASALTGTTLPASVVTSSITTLGTVVTAPNVDLLNAVNTHTLAGLHTWTGGTNGAQRLVAVNTTSNTAALSGFRADAGTTVMVLDAFSQGYTTSGSAIAASVKLEAAGAGGLTINTSNAAGPIRFYPGGAAERGRMHASGGFSWGDTTDPGANNARLAGALAMVGVATFTAQPIMSSLTASQAVFTDGSKGLVSNAITGSGSVVMSASPTLTGTISAAAATFSGVVQGKDGTAGSPTFGFTNDTDTGIYSAAANIVGLAAGGTEAVTVSFATNVILSASGGNWGTGNVTGSLIVVGRDASGSGAAGDMVYTDKNGALRYTWVDAAGDLRISTAAPQEDGTPSDTSGTVVGTQTSVRSTKNIYGRFTDNAGALRTILGTKLYDFDYKSGAYNHQRFVGITTDDSPLFGMDLGRSFNPITAFGYTVAAFKAQADELNALRARVLALEKR